MLFTPTKYCAHTKILAHHLNSGMRKHLLFPPPPRWMLILSILEEQVRSGESRKGNKAAVRSLVRWQRQLGSAALTQITHQKAQMLNKAAKLFFSRGSWCLPSTCWCFFFFSGVFFCCCCFFFFSLSFLYTRLLTSRFSDPFNKKVGLKTSLLSHRQC